MPKYLRIEFIDNIGQLPALFKELYNSKYIGIDTEWRSAKSPAILQISNKNCAYLVDLIALGNSKELDNTLC